MQKPNIMYVAVKALIKNDAGKVLILKQSDPTITGTNSYHPPGGIVELGESVAECVVREIKEETGATAKAVHLFDMGEWQSQRGENIMQFIALYYVCTIDSDTFTLQTEEVSEYQWVGLEEIDSIDIMEPSKSVIKRFLEMQQ